MEASTTITKGRFVIPEVVATHFHLREGDIVGDFGAGSGFFTEVLSLAVGQSGRVYSCEIQKDLVEKIGTLARSKGLSNVDPLWCDIEEPGGIKIANETLNVAILINTFFQSEDKTVTLAEIARTIKSGGKFFVVDWSESFGGLGPQPGQVVSSSETKMFAESAGFVYERDFDAGDHHYGLAFRKV